MSKIQVNEIVNHFDNGAPDCPRGLTVTGVSTFSGNVSIGGTLSYEDVTNIDSVGIITARDGLDTPTDLVLRTGGTEKLRVTSAGITSITGSLEVNGNNYPTAGALSNRNFIMNGDMRIAQRSTSAVNNVTAGSNPNYDTLDRWGFWAYSNNLFTTQQVADAPQGFYNSIKVTSLVSATMGTGAYATVSQRIEAQNLYSSNIGTSTAKDFIVSFWVKGSISGTYTFYAFNSDWQQSFAKEYTINVANTWEHKTLTIPGPTTGFSATGNARQLEIGFSLGAGTTWSTSVLDQWQTSAFKLNSSTATNLLETSGATLNFTGVQLELGSKATPFEYESYGQTLAKCQRYYWQVTNTTGNRKYLGIVQAYNTTSTFGILTYVPVEMRADANPGISGGFGFYNSASAVASTTSPANLDFTQGRIETGTWVGGSGLTAGQGLVSFWDNNAVIYASAEL